MHKIYEGLAEKMQALREGYRPSPELREKMNEHREAMLAAREAGDEDKLREIRQQMRALQEERRQAMAPMREKMEALQTAHHDELLAIMHKDQKERFEKLWNERMKPRGFGGPRRSAHALKTVVKKLPDLTSEQEQQIEALFTQYKEATREMERRSLEHRKLTSRLYDDVVKLLTPEQQKVVEENLRGRRGPEKRRAHKHSASCGHDEGKHDHPPGDEEPDED